MSQLVATDEGIVTSAHKSWVTAANHADSYVSSARSIGAASPLDSTLYLTRRNDRVKVNGAFTGLGLRGNDSAPMLLQSVPIPQEHMLTRPSEGAPMLLGVVLPWFSIGSGSDGEWIVRGRGRDHRVICKAPWFEHTGEKLRDLAVLRDRLAEMSVRTESARALLAQTLHELEHPSDSTQLFVLQTRLASLQAAVDVTDLAMKTCGGAAFSRHLPIERLFRDARAGWVMAPTVDQLKDFIGKALTGLPLF